MGQYNSSVTRVWPVFDWLFALDPTGRCWLADLLQMGSLSGNVTQSFFRDAGSLLPELGHFGVVMPCPLARVLGSDRCNRLGNIRNAFERDFPPSGAFLRWLISNPEQLVWPRDTGGRERNFASHTEDKRRRLLAGELEARNEALSALDSVGAHGSRRKWWAFEGFTSVDCLLETETLLVFIEGKRTEGISSATDWFPRRNQIIRNLEVAREMAGDTKEYAVLICAEQYLELPETVWRESLPHLPACEIEELRRHYLGCATWEEISHRLCPDLRLPDMLDDALSVCAALRPEPIAS